MYVCMYVSFYVSICVCIYLSIYISIYIYIYIYIHTHAHTHAHTHTNICIPAGNKLQLDHGFIAVVKGKVNAFWPSVGHLESEPFEIDGIFPRSVDFEIWKSEASGPPAAYTSPIHCIRLPASLPPCDTTTGLQLVRVRLRRRG